MRIAIVVGCSIVGALLATEPVAAQSVNAELIDGLHAKLRLVAVPVTALFLGALAYAAVRFRAEATDEPTTTPEKPALEVAWVAATVAILLAVGLAAYPVLTTPYLSPGSQPGGASGDEAASVALSGNPNVTEIEVVAAQWTWRVHYADANVTTRDELVLPADEEVRLVLTSRDVIHALAIPALGVKRDAVPGEETAIRTRVREPGTYAAQCTEFCGTGHAAMRANVTVVDRETYDAWLAAREGEDAAPAPAP